jgi:hypothetical protein
MRVQRSSVPWIADGPHLAKMLGALPSLPPPPRMVVMGGIPQAT